MANSERRNQNVQRRGHARLNILHRPENPPAITFCGKLEDTLVYLRNKAGPWGEALGCW